jgi:hypothetical protein
MREAGARGRHFIAHCSQCLLASVPLPSPRPRAERRLRTLGWTGKSGDQWLCPRCVVRDVDVFFDDPSLRGLTTSSSDARCQPQVYLIRITCPRSPVVLPSEGADAPGKFAEWVKVIVDLARTTLALKASLMVALASFARLPSGVTRVTPKPASIDFERFDEESLALVRVTWELDVEATLRPDARALRWIRLRQTLASMTSAGSLGFDLTRAEAWLLTP